MSPSRIPRPGGMGSPTINTSPLSQSTTTTSTTRPALGTLVHTSKNPFAQLNNNVNRNVSQNQQNHGSPTPSNGSGNLTVNGKGVPVNKRRIKPPSPDLNEDGSPILNSNGSSTRRPVPSSVGDTTKPRIPSNPGPGSGSGQGQHRSILRQPSTPALVSSSAHRSSPVAQSRPRALSSTSVSVNKPIIVHRNTNNSPNPQEVILSNQNDTKTKGGMIRSFGSQHKLSSLFFDSSSSPSLTTSQVQSNVPIHIRIRLKLIHRLGCLLNIDSIGISSKIDIPTLLARVDHAYDREKDRSLGNNNNVEVVALNGSTIPTTNTGSKGVFGMFKRLGGGNNTMRKSEENGSKVNSVTPQEGPAFGVPLSEAPPGSWCTSLIGGQKHELPLVVFTIIEEIYRRGMSQPGIFRLAGDGIRISHLTKVFNLPPLYGDSLPINQEPIHNLTGLVKRYIRDLPEPILDESLFPAFLAFCVGSDNTKETEKNEVDKPKNDKENEKHDNENEEEGNSNLNETSTGNDTSSAPTPMSSTLEHDLIKLPIEKRIIAAQILLKLLPPLQFSLFIYLLAFLGQLPLFPDNRLNIESISIIFGPAMCASRGKGISGLGPGPTNTSHNNSHSNNINNNNSSNNTFDSDSVSDLVSKSQNVLSWLLKNWSGISEKVLEDDESLSSSLSPNTDHNHGNLTEDLINGGSTKEKDKKMKKEKTIIDPRLLSPIDLRGSNSSNNDGGPMRGGKGSKSNDDSPNSSQSPINIQIPKSKSSLTLSSAIHSIESSLSSPTSPNIQTPHTHIQLGGGSGGTGGNLRKSSSSHTLKSKSSNSSFGMGMKTSTSSSSGFGIKSSPSSGGLLARALSSMSISSQAQGGGNNDDKYNTSGGGLSKGPKRSASFTSLSSLVKKVGKDHKHPPLPTRSLSDDRDNAHSTVNPQITTVLGSLHDLLVSKDKQIERDARELALLRHTLLEMDEKLQKATLSSPLPGPIGLNGCTCPIHPNATSSGSSGDTIVIGKEGTITSSVPAATAPEITITSTPSSSTIQMSESTCNVKNQNDNIGDEKQIRMKKEIMELQIQLKTALGGLENQRINLTKINDKNIILDSKLVTYQKEFSKLQVSLALEQARSVGLIEERDLARERLEKIKTTLFSVN
ncbi:uncharacterized protein L201_003756 [Kwoniella dendrophila CBS 6074]|uniref:Rho-GAP domain-containing protein n=1 Tax=Kwoniella dendrophila CBS 6074 TaxID=1295534 RepID=A0AAX4JTT0_9TREE